MTKKIITLVPVFLLMALLATFLFADTWTQTLSTEFSTDTMTNVETANDAVTLMDVPVNSSWTEANWPFRRTITIDNKNASALSNYQVKITNPILDETGLIGSWHLDYATTGNLINGSTTGLGDSSGNNSNGTASNNGSGMTWTTGKFDGAVSFDGVDDYIPVDLAQNPSVFAISFWAKDPAGNWNHYAESNGVQYVNGVQQTYNNKYFIRTGTTLNIGTTALQPNSNAVSGNLRLWLDPNFGITMDGSNKVSLWNDKSGQGNNAVQATYSQQPVFTAAVINNQPVLRFTAASSQTMVVSTNFPAPVTVLCVERLTSGANSRMLTARFNNWLLGFWGGARAQGYFEGWVTPSGTPAANTTWYLYSCTIPGAGQNSTVYENGTVIAASQNGVTGPNGFSLSGYFASSEFSNGDIAEVILYNRVLTSQEWQGVQSYLATKYALSVTPTSYGYYNGSLDEVRVYNRAISPEEIKALYECKARSNYADIRFTKSDGTVLPHWVEKDGTIWVKMTGTDSVPAGLSRIYMYYGNPSATNASSGSGAFDFFEDFEDGDSTGWSLNSGTAFAIKTDKTAGNYSYGYGAASGRMSASFTPAVPYIIESDVYFTSNTGDSVVWGNETSATNYVAAMDINAGWHQYWSSGAWVSSGLAPFINKWNTLKIVYKSSAAADYYEGPMLIKSNAVISGTPDRLMIGAYHSATRYDNVRVRQYAAIEPVTTVYAEQENLAFGYYKSLTLDNTGGALTNYQMQIKTGYNTAVGVDVNLESRSREDFGDVRFGDATGKTYPYYLETFTTADKATFWVRIPSIPAGSSTIYIFYGNASARSASDGQSVFDLYNPSDSSLITTWTRYASNPVINLGAGGTLDDTHVYENGVLRDTDGLYKMWYSGHDGVNVRICYATSVDGATWTKYSGNPVLNLGAGWESVHTYKPFVMKDSSDGTYKMWYAGYGGSNWRIGYATSLDGITWTRYAGNPVLNIGAGWEANHIYGCSVIKESDGTCKMWYSAQDSTNLKIGYATSTDGITWNKYVSNPVLTLGAGGTWDDVHVGLPNVLKDSDGQYKMFYSGNDGGNWRLGYATSSDGITWTKFTSNPVLNLGTGWDDTGAYSPVVMRDTDGYYKMWYSGLQSAVTWRLGYAYVRPRKYSATPPTVSGVGTETAWASNVGVWNKGATIKITNSNASILTNHQVSVTVNTSALISAGQMNIDCSDIKFTSTYDYDESKWTIVYPHWIESGINTASTKIWIKVDSIPASTDKYICMFYNNPASAATGSFGKTFVKDYDESGLVALWHLDEGTGTAVYDGSTMGNTGTMAGFGSPNGWQNIDGGQWDSRNDVRFPAGYSLAFDGTDDTISVNCTGVDTATANAKTTVEFWMYWDGTYGASGRMPFGWSSYNLYMVSAGYFGYNTANSDIYGINTTGLANRWVHVVAIFNNGVVTSNSLYIDGVAQTLTQKQGAPLSRNVSATAKISGWNNDANYKFGGRMDEFRIYNRALLAGEITAHFNRRKYAATDPTVTVTSTNTIPTEYLTPGAMVSTSIAPVKIYQWGALTFTKTTPANTALTIDVLKASDDSTLAADVASGTVLSTLPAVQAETAIKLRANLSATNNITTPTLSDWTLVYTVDTTAPSPTPNTPVLSNGSASQITVTWTAATDTQSGLAPYILERAPDSGGIPGIWIQLATPVTNTYTDSAANNPSDPMQANTKYHYRVTAVDNFGNDAIGTSSSDITPPAPAPNDPVLTLVTPNRVDLAWAAATDAESGFYQYVIERAPDSGGFAGTYIQVGTSVTNSWADYSANNPAFPPQANTQYHYRVRAYDNFNNYASGSSSTKCMFANTPVSADASISYSDHIVITWQSGGAQHHYKVYRDGISGVGTLIYNSTPATVSDTITGTHAYYVYAVNAEDVETSAYTEATGQTIPSLAVDPSLLQFTATEGGADPATQTVSIWNSSTGSFNWTVTKDDSAAWLAVTPSSGSTSTDTDTVSFTASVGSLTPGDYSTSVTITADGITYGTPKAVTVVFNITAKPPAIGLGSNMLTFTAVEYSTDPVPQSFQIWNSSGGSLPLNWNITGAPPWLKLGAISGASDDSSDINTITVAPGISGFVASGSPYSAVLSIAASNASNSPQTVAVTVNIVSQAPPEISTDPEAIDISVLYGSDTAGAIKIFNTGGKMLNWVASDTASWISFNTYKGSASTEKDTVAISFDTSSLSTENSPYSASIIIADADASNSPYTIPVTLNVLPLNANYVTIATGQYTPYESNITNASMDVEMLQVEISAVCPDDVLQVNSMAFAASGTGDEAVDISAVSLYKDVNDNGIIDAEDIQIGESKTFAADNGAIIFDQINETLNNGETKTFLISYTFSGNAQLEKQFSLELMSSAGLNVTIVSDSSSAYIVGEYPVAGATKTVSDEGTIAVAAGPHMPFASSLAKNEPDAGMLQLAVMVSDVEDVDVSWIAFTSSGTGIENDDIKTLGVRLIEDTDGDGVADEGEAQIGTRQTFHSDNGSVIFADLNKTLAKGTASYWLLTYSFAGIAADNVNFSASLAINSNLYAVGASSGATIQVSGAPVDGNKMTLTDTVLEDVEIEGGEVIVQSTGSNSSGAGKCLISRLMENKGSVLILIMLCLMAVAMAYKLKIKN